MKLGDKCIFTVGQDMFDGKIKKNHKYVGRFWRDKWVRYRTYTIKAKTIDPIERTITIKPKAPTASDYKNLGDVLFETAIRYRDNFTSVISGEKFPEFTWNELQAGHGVSRQHWATRHNPLNCHAITSGQNFHMSLGTAKTIAQYWAYVAKKYGQDVVDSLLNEKHESPKLSIRYLKEDCEKQYDFLTECLEIWNKKSKIKRSAFEVLCIRCERFPKAKKEGMFKVLDLITKGDL